jgi:hypothetical protein
MGASRVAAPAAEVSEFATWVVYQLVVEWLLNSLPATKHREVRLLPATWFAPRNMPVARLRRLIANVQFRAVMEQGLLN